MGKDSAYQPHYMLYDAELKFRLPSGWKERLEELGKLELPEVTASEVARRAIADHLRKKRNKKQKPQPVV